MAALYTPPSLSQSPSHSSYAEAMNAATLPPLPTELLATWSLWRHPKSQQLPLTPLSVPSKRADRPQLTTTTTLPPIAQLDRQLSRISPLTPADDEPIAGSSRLPPVSSVVDDASDFYQDKPSIPSPAPHLVDWFTSTQKRSAHFIAEKTCEMICYLWFSNTSSKSPSSHSPSESDSAPYFPSSNASTASFQLVASPAFISFMQKLLETTQVSQSVIVLSLHYIYRLKERNRFTNGQPGSEFRVAVAALMMANKFVDDNTYTNKTWSEISSISLSEVNRMEREFLMGVDFDLYVDKSTYESWLNLLKGLVMAKERDSRRWKSSRGRDPRAAGKHGVVHRSIPPRSAHPYTGRRERARSTSPEATGRSTFAYSEPAPQPFTFSLPPAPSTVSTHTGAEYTSSPLESGSKRSAEAAFSPTPTASSFAPAALLPPRPVKRPASMTGLSLQIPEYPCSRPQTAKTSGPCPLEGLNGFSKLSLAASPAVPSPASSRSQTQSQLTAAYHVDTSRREDAPQNLYYYSLACSPSDEEASAAIHRKGKLRVHQAPTHSNSYYSTCEMASCPSIPSRAASFSGEYDYSSGGRLPMVVQSASTSPIGNAHMNNGCDYDYGSLQLPPIQYYDEESGLARRASVPTIYESLPSPDEVLRSAVASRVQPQPQYAYDDRSMSSASSSPDLVPSAPFANAGPPGVQFYAYSSPAQLRPPHASYYHHHHHRPSPSSPDLSQFQWPSRGRQS